ncbi:MAG TPA: hypothetical protein VN845_05310 [Solirubrobacteraceae bacterium]|nr:hypothetical protein [Solirubrobacteraceae bacterium]
MTRVPIVLLASALLALGASACGSSSKGANAPPSGETSTHGTVVSNPSGAGTAIASYGQAASAADMGAITTLVKRYYAAAAAENGALACSFTYYIEVETLPEHYGGPPGPRWLHGADTCPTLLTRVFKHFHSKLTGPVDVMAVRVKGQRAEALVGFPGLRLPEGVVKIRREGDGWKVNGLLAVAPE